VLDCAIICILSSSGVCAKQGWSPVGLTITQWNTFL